MSIIILISSTICACYLITMLHHRVLRFRKKWRETATRALYLEGELLRWRESKKDWQEIAQSSVIDNNRLKEKTAQLSKTVTDLSVAVDSMMNGNMVCGNGHKYYSDGSGGQCPHCGSKQMTFIIPMGKRVEECVVSPEDIGDEIKLGDLAYLDDSGNINGYPIQEMNT